MQLKAISFLGLLIVVLTGGDVLAQSQPTRAGRKPLVEKRSPDQRSSSLIVSPLRRLDQSKRPTDKIVPATQKTPARSEGVVAAKPAVRKLEPMSFSAITNSAQTGKKPAGAATDAAKTPGKQEEKKPHARGTAKKRPAAASRKKPAFSFSDDDLRKMTRRGDKIAQKTDAAPASKPDAAISKKTTASQAPKTENRSTMQTFSKDDLLRMTGQAPEKKKETAETDFTEPQEEKKPAAKTAKRENPQPKVALNDTTPTQDVEKAETKQETPGEPRAALNAAPVKAKKKPVDYDVVLLKNGQEFVGRVTQEDDRKLTVLFRGGEIVLPKSRIKQIVRAERAEVERRAVAETVVLGRYEEREEFYFVYYRGRRVGWRKTSIAPEVEQEKRGYRFLNRTVFMKKNGGLDMDMNVSEFVDSDLRPVSLLTMEESENYGHPTSGIVSKGHLELKEGMGESQSTREILFSDETEFLQPLVRKLADLSHFPEAGETFKVFDSQRSQFVMVHASRSLRKEIVAGKHQFVTVWKFKQGKREWEIWIDGYGGLVREELGGPHMVALRAKPELVLAYARGEAKDGDGADITLEYENVPEKFRLARPNLTWSFEFPEFDSPVAITLLNPTLQASADVIVLDHVEDGTAPETMALDLMSRMNRKSENHNILFQKTGALGGTDAIRFESTSERKGTAIRTIGAVSVTNGRAYAVLLAAPSFSFDKVRGQLERILESFEILGGQVKN